MSVGISESNARIQSAGFPEAFRATNTMCRPSGEGTGSSGAIVSPSGAENVKRIGSVAGAGEERLRDGSASPIKPAASAPAIVANTHGGNRRATGA